MDTRVVTRQDKFFKHGQANFNSENFIHFMRNESRRIDFQTRRTDRLSAGLCSKSDIENYSNFLNLSFNNLNGQSKKEVAVNYIQILHLNLKSQIFVEAVLFFINHVTIHYCNEIYLQLKDLNLHFFTFDFLSYSSFKIQVLLHRI